MKFLYLKGVEVFGPTDAADLVKETWFSDDLLVCPEDKAEQESAWKSAKDYPEFKLSLEQAIFPAKEETQPVAESSAKPAAEEVKQAPIAPAAPIVRDIKNSQELPALEDTKTDTDLKDKKETIDAHEVVEEPLPKIQAPEVMANDPQDHTFRIPQKEDDNILEDLPSQSIFESDKKEENNTPVVLGGESQTVPENSKQPEVMDHATPLAEPLPTADAGDSVNRPSFLEISNNKILSSSDGRVKKEKKNDLIFILSIIVITVVLIALGFAFFNMSKGKQEAQSLPQEQENEIQTPAAVEQEKFQNNPFEEDEQPNLIQEQQKSVEDATIDIVKNTMLENKGKTIGEYLQNTYGEDFQTSWSAKPFTDKIYIVEFFASKVRNEPFVYLFRVDTEQQKITGALNNITLDLIG